MDRAHTDPLQLLSDYEDAVTAYNEHLAAHGDDEAIHLREALRLHRVMRRLRVAVAEQMTQLP